jgi:curli production assembly/transport component CsgG
MSGALSALRLALTLVAVLALAGCAGPLDRVHHAQGAASLGDMTAQNRALRAVPPAAQRVRVAVYDLPDLTGKYEESETAQTLSRAVTQGGASLLIKALQDAGERRWFTVLDRSRLEDLIRERQIITEMRRIYRGEQQTDPDVLGPLAHAGILISGAITGYDSNVQTGGLGARYLGIGVDRRWKLDVVTVNLRAVSTETSEVLASVTVRKPIASIADRGSVFTYVALDELLEAETGVAANEPGQVALEQAVEKAVMALIAEGASTGLWHFADAAAGAAFVRGVREEQFDGAPTPAGSSPPPPATAASVTIPETVPAHRAPARAAPVRERRLPPAPPSPPPPPPPPPPPDADAREVLG